LPRRRASDTIGAVQAVGTIWRVARDPVLSRVQFAFAGFALAEHGTWLALLFYAYGRGGVREAGLIAFVSLLPAVILAPLAAYAGDRFRPDRALAAGLAVQASAMGVTAVAMWLDETTVAYGAAIVAMTAVSCTRPVMAALLPLLTHRPEDLIAANVVAGFAQNTGSFIGPLVAGGILSFSGAGSAFAVFGAMVGVSAALALSLQPVARSPQVAIVTARDVLREVSAGLDAVRAEVPVGLVIAILGVSAMVVGAADVLVVTLAETTLAGGGGQAGLLAAAVGLGAIGGSVVATGLIGGARCFRYLIVAAVILGAPLLALPQVEQLLPALALFGAIGVGRSLLAVTGSVAIQRRAPRHARARVFGLLEGLETLAVAGGAAVIAVLIDRYGLGIAVTGLSGAAVTLMVLGSVLFLRLGGDVAPPPPALIDRLLADPILRHLDSPTLERLALSLRQRHVEARTTVVREGEEGRHYYLVQTGGLQVTQKATTIRALGPGDSFGEIALIHRIPRTATVTASTDAQLLVVSRDDFLNAVTGQLPSLAAVSDVVNRHLTNDGRPTAIGEPPVETEPKPSA
jgi:CBS domain-containing protein